MTKGRHRIATVLSIALLASGCALTPAATEPVMVEHIRTRAGFAHAEINGSETADRIDWWADLGGSGLSEAVARLRTHNFDLIEARERVVQAELRAVQARGGRFPSAGADLGAAYGRAPVPPAGFEWDDSYSLGLTASFNTDIFGQLRARERSARLGSSAARLNYVATEQQLIAILAQSWVNAASLQRRLELAIEIAESYRVTYTLTDQRYDTGSRNTAASDVQIARQNLEAALADIPDLETQLAAQLIQIDLLLARPAGQTAQYFESDLSVDRQMIIPAGLPADLLMDRPDVAAAALSYQAALEDIGAARADLFPGLTLTTALSFQGDEPGDVVDFDDLLANLAASLTQPVFQGGRLRAEVQIQESEAAALSSAFARAALTALTDVETALVQQSGLIRQLEQLDAALRSAEISNQIAQDRYRQGLIPLLSVLETQRSLNAARLNIILTEQALILARIDLHQSLGGRWFDDAEERQSIAGEVP
ncbi:MULTISPECIES: TolC family protein [Hyphobacterium]|uniref:TolC family protein n=1 Tax=Hyphobacterium vulgare TaxID=1736751 RepID=A0ABV7A0U5_9PROT